MQTNTGILPHFPGMMNFKLFYEATIFSLHPWHSAHIGIPSFSVRNTGIFAKNKGKVNLFQARFSLQPHTLAHTKRKLRFFVSSIGGPFNPFHRNSTFFSVFLCALLYSVFRNQSAHPVHSLFYCQCGSVLFHSLNIGFTYTVTIAVYTQHSRKSYTANMAFCLASLACNGIFLSRFFFQWDYQWWQIAGWICWRNTCLRNKASVW